MRQQRGKGFVNKWNIFTSPQPRGFLSLQRETEKFETLSQGRYLVAVKSPLWISTSYMVECLGLSLGSSILIKAHPRRQQGWLK